MPIEPGIPRWAAVSLLSLIVLLACETQAPDEDPTNDPPGDIAMITPFVVSADIASVPEAFSTTASAPWGFAHDGVDFVPSGNMKPFRSVAPGTVEVVDLWQNDATGNWQVNVRVRYNATFSVEYVFEPFSPNPADGQTQLAGIGVTEGQTLTQGQTIGTLHSAGAGVHLHFGLYRNGTPICPEPYFTAAARDATLALIRTSDASWEMCY